MAKMQLDFTESAKQLAPEGEYLLRWAPQNKLVDFNKTGKKPFVLGPSKASGKPVWTLQWEPFNPPPGVSMDQIEKCVILDWVSLSPNALFTAKNLIWACGQQIECSNCHAEYEANLDTCPECQSAVFLVDWDFLDSAQPGAFVKIEKDQKGERDVNTIKKYFRPS